MQYIGTRTSWIIAFSIAVTFALVVPVFVLGTEHDNLDAQHFEFIGTGSSGGTTDNTSTAVDAGSTGSMQSVEQVASNVAANANAMCNPVDPRCPCGQKMTSDGCKGGANMFMCPCSASIPGVPGGMVTGICMAAGKCEGLQYSGGGMPGGGVDQGLQMLSGFLQQLMSQLGGGGGGGGDTSQIPTFDPNSSFFDPNSQQFDFGSPFDNIFDNTNTPTFDFGGGGTTSFFDFGDGSTVPSFFDLTDDVTNIGDDPTSSDDPFDFSLKLNEKGDIVRTFQVETDTGVVEFTVVEDEAEEEGSRVFRSVVDTLKPMAGILSGPCARRPWAGSLLSRVIPDAFFDGICRALGLDVGTPIMEAPAPVTIGTPRTLPPESVGVIDETVERGIECIAPIIRPGDSAELAFSCAPAKLVGTAGFQVTNAAFTRMPVTPTRTTQYGILCSDDFTASCTIRVVNPEARIWSVPAEPRLGTRAVIQWNSKDVDSCVVEGPSFYETTLSGGASTVPFTRAETFTITCVSVDDSSVVSDSITVGLGL